MRPRHPPPPRLRPAGRARACRARWVWGYSFAGKPWMLQEDPRGPRAGAMRRRRGGASRPREEHRRPHREMAGPVRARSPGSGSPSAAEHLLALGPAVTGQIHLSACRPRARPPSARPTSWEADRGFGACGRSRRGDRQRQQARRRCSQSAGARPASSATGPVVVLSPCNPPGRRPMALAQASARCPWRERAG